MPMKFASWAHEFKFEEHHRRDSTRQVRGHHGFIGFG